MISNTEKSYIQQYGKSFFWAGFFLPKKLFSNASHLYDFCRIVDNIADDEQLNKVDKTQSLNEFEENFNNKNFDVQVIKNIWDVINNFNPNFTKENYLKFLRGLMKKEEFEF